MYDHSSWQLRPCDPCTKCHLHVWWLHGEQVLRDRGLTSRTPKKMGPSVEIGGGGELADIAPKQAEFA